LARPVVVESAKKSEEKMTETKSITQQLSEKFCAKGDPTGWFEEIYRISDGEIEQIPWADLVPNPCLVDWLKQNEPPGKRAIVVGCGLGDDVDFLAREGFDVTGFDIAQTAIAMSRQRYPAIADRFQVADLFALSRAWEQGFDLVFECNTIQALTGDLRLKALNAIAGLVAPGGLMLVSCRSRNPGEKEQAFPLPLDHQEIAGFERAGLKKLSLEEYQDDQQPPVPHFFACYQR
jgi:SAM-dependent methyltransferase